jgi:low temperature requirement protein LtrA
MWSPPGAWANRELREESATSDATRLPSARRSKPTHTRTRRALLVSVRRDSANWGTRSIAAMRLAVSRASGAERVVTPLELFFDVVYIFALGQLSHRLFEDVDMRTGAETVILALAVFSAWYMIVWGANWLDPDSLPVRGLFVGLTFASLLMSAGIADAFDGRAWLFVTGYLLLQFGRSTFLIVALRGRPLGEHFVNVLVWELLIGLLWVAGAITDESQRIVLWTLAVVATYGGAWALNWLPRRGRAIDLRHVEIAGRYLIERFRLFFIILLGETVLTMGNTFADEPFEIDRLLALMIGFTGTVALWWCYFQRTEGLGVDAAKTAEGAGAVGWWGTSTLTLIVLATIGIAVGDEMAIAHPGDDPTLGFTIVTFGGPALFLLAQVTFCAAVFGYVPRSRLFGLAALALLAVATAPLTLIVAIAAWTAVLVAIAVVDTIRAGDRAQSRESPARTRNDKSSRS